MFLSSGSPGCMRFSIPSSPAWSTAASVRYGFPVESGQRNSTRFASGLSEATGILIAALLFRCEYARFTGASKPGTSRL